MTSSRPSKAATPTSPPPPLELETISSQWQVSLDATEAALNAAATSLTAQELGRGRSELAQERVETLKALTGLAHETGTHPTPWLSPVPVSNDLLGLPAGVTSCVFDLDGVLTDSAVLHARAWREVLDQFLLQRSNRAGWEFVPFDREHDYAAFFEGRPRLEGIHTFLASRGIRLPEGRVGDRADAETAYGLARRKGEVLARGLRQRGSTALRGARRYLQAAGHAGLSRAVISASSNTSRILELAGLGLLIEERLDANVIRAKELRSRPAPDLPLEACDRLGASPGEAVAFTHSPAGIAAGRSAGLLVIGIGEGAQEEVLRAYGAEQVYPSLLAMLDRRLAGD